MQKIDHTYNIKGWLKKINEPDLSGGEGDFFGVELLYNEGFAALNGTAMYNGNISGMKWKNGSSGSTQKGYGFIYDQINRLTTSKYGEGTSYTTNVSRYDENLTYDKNGNIRKLYRNGQINSGVFGNIDSLGYKYPGTGNQVWAIGDIVTDVAGRGDFYDATNGYTNKEYYYDKNGNMWLDRNKRMKTIYNYLNLPARISDTVNTANKIEYVYTSAGEKLKQRLSTGTTLLYFGNYVYTLDGTANGIAIKYILTQEGRATNSAGTYTYEYFMKDHLGNTRVSFNVPSSTAVIVQQSDYYPFGMIHQPQATTTSDNRLLYNGKELQNNLLGGINLDLYDFKSRYLDPQIGRFTTSDPFADKFSYVSPYNYAENRPIDGIDLWGLQWVSIKDKQGNTNVKVNVNFNFGLDLNILPKGTTVADYQAAISNQFNTTLQASSNGTFSGQVTYKGGVSEELGQVVPSLSIYGNKPQAVIGEITSFSASFVNIYNVDGSIKSINDLAIDAVHELLHTVRIEHPFDKTQGPDTKLVNVGINSYATTLTTDPKIQYNIMNYGLISINRQILSELWKTQSPIFLTNDQLNLMQSEIKMQKEGYGTMRADYFDYWLNTPGTAVTKK